ncbi:MAG: class I SAM-dependent methyltransferase [Gemmatimonadales bacterium]|nr:class I SAM-dependent methyltransferase [Gemmatimonadales bacterium]MYG49300.1 class I SAM-dependent methyltransferase [Gemmatimonadales bacterium]MYK00778.1 class I SAM-dependent methyltransferase [Candidatus Palauibacter ramosifaciens]
MKQREGGSSRAWEAPDGTAPETHDYQGRDLEAMSSAVRYHRDILRMFSPYLGDRILEVGAGSGNISRLILERQPSHLYALEPSDSMYALLRERVRGSLNATVHHSLLSDFLKAENTAGMDSVVSINVLEHVQDDVAELARMRAALRPGGYLCLWVPALPALTSRFDRSLGHFRRYRRRDVLQKLERTGFVPVRLAYRDIVGMLAWFVVCRVLRQELSPGKVSMYDRFVMPVTGACGRRLNPPLGKNLMAIARRP